MLTKILTIALAFGTVAVAVCAVASPTVTHYYCKYCGHKTTSVNSLTSSLCQRHPDGALKGRHAPAL